ncbi:MAG TPA: competence/damage-inducible protein A, partial [Candidatus Acidoferrum sp.]|nr:competence/damage-inducible protein A [Candidatus Acidoferrum sp.]
MRIELINTGAELLVGRVLNTHQQWLCRQLTDLGYEVSRQVCVADDGEQIQAVARESLQRADAIIITGGLGPTSDDRTRDFIAQMLGRKLVLHPDTRGRIEQFFAARPHPMPAKVLVQAMIPEGATVLPNANGTAPGLALETKRGKQWLILLPGPPRELRPMFVESVVPLLRREFPLASKYLCRTIKTTGLGESVVEEKIDAALRPLASEGLELAYCARVGEVDVRLAGRGEKAEALLAEGMARVERLLGPAIFGREDESLESVVIGLLTSGKKTVAVAESCTGGFLAHRLTNVAGASAVFLGGVVAYSNAIKRDILGVRAETLRQHGAVSEAVAREMAEGARRLVGADYALAVTGIAGPGGGTPEKPVGTAYVGLSESKGTTVQFQYSPVDRET